MIGCIPSSILTLITRRVFKMEEEEWGGIQISVETCVLELGSPYTRFLPVQSFHTDDPLLATLEFTHMVNDNKEVV